MKLGPFEVFKIYVGEEGPSLYFFVIGNMGSFIYSPLHRYYIKFYRMHETFRPDVSPGRMYPSLQNRKDRLRIVKGD